MVQQGHRARGDGATKGEVGDKGRGQERGSVTRACGPQGGGFNRPQVGHGGKRLDFRF